MSWNKRIIYIYNANVFFSGFRVYSYLYVYLISSTYEMVYEMWCIFIAEFLYTWQVK